MAVQALLLAAGASRRFQGDKLLADVGGEPMVARAATNLTDAGLRVLSVVRDGRGQVAQLLGNLPGVEIGVCAQAQHGMGVSLAWGVAATPSADGWLVALGDMPMISPATIRALVQAMEAGASLVSPQCRGRRGHPVGFARDWRPHLLALTGDHGGRGLLAAHPTALTLVEVDDPGVLLDIDLPADFARHFPG